MHLPGDEPWMLKHAVNGLSVPWVSLADCAEPTTRFIVDELGMAGLRVIMRDPECDAALRRAEALIGHVPTLQGVVRSVVTGVIRLQSDDPAVDISQSEPRWGGTVFVSFPPRSPVGDIRLAESIIHEAMHVHLSATGLDEPTCSPEPMLYSPWRDGPRPASGVLHGAYVFVCLLRFYVHLVRDCCLSDTKVTHIQRRQAEISGELECLSWCELSAAFTGETEQLCRWMQDCLRLDCQEDANVRF
jgi:hypothetical protein